MLSDWLYVNHHRLLPLMLEFWWLRAIGTLFWITLVSPWLVSMSKFRSTHITSKGQFVSMHLRVVRQQPFILSTVVTVFTVHQICFMHPDMLQQVWVVHKTSFTISLITLETGDFSVCNLMLSQFTFKMKGLSTVCALLGFCWVRVSVVG